MWNWWRKPQPCTFFFKNGTQTWCGCICGGLWWGIMEACTCLKCIVVTCASLCGHMCSYSASHGKRNLHLFLKKKMWWQVKCFFSCMAMPHVVCSGKGWRNRRRECGKDRNGVWEMFFWSPFCKFEVKFFVNWILFLLFSLSLFSPLSLAVKSVIPTLCSCWQLHSPQNQLPLFWWAHDELLPSSKWTACLAN